MTKFRSAVCLCVFTAAIARAAPIVPFADAMLAEPAVQGVERASATPQDVLVRDDAGTIPETTPVPEPAVIVSMGSGLLALAALWRRHVRRSMANRRSGRVG